MTEKKCYDCIHRVEVLGSVHSSCQHPATGRRSGMISMHGSGKAAAELGIVGAKHGIINGWFLWPVNFDPIWLESCNGFEQRTTQR